MAGACLFLAAKVEEQPRKLEHIVRHGYMCAHRDQPQLDVKSDVSTNKIGNLSLNSFILTFTNHLSMKIVITIMDHLLQYYNGVSQLGFESVLLLLHNPLMTRSQTSDAEGDEAEMHLQTCPL